MGHANLTNISRRTNRMLLTRKTITIREIVNELEAKKMALHASEGEYKERFMLSYGTEDVMRFLLENGKIEPVEMTRRQKKIFREWMDWSRTRSVSDWDCGDDGEGGEYAILDSIKWRALKKRLFVLAHITH